jgi:hypothetical protein
MSAQHRHSKIGRVPGMGRGETGKKEKPRPRSSTTQIKWIKPREAKVKASKEGTNEEDGEISYTPSSSQ